MRTLTHFQKECLPRLQTNLINMGQGMEVERTEENHFIIKGHGVTTELSYVPFTEDEGNLVIEITSRPFWLHIDVIIQGIEEAFN